MGELYRLKFPIGPAEVVNELEQSLRTERLEKGRQFRILRRRHLWAVDPDATAFEAYTIVSQGNMYNVLWNILEPAMEQIDPPVGLNEPPIEGRR